MVDELLEFVKYTADMNEAETHALLVAQMIDLATVVVGITKELVDSFGLTESEARLLWLTDPDAEPMPLKQVATLMHFDPSNVTLISSKLDEKGLARRVPHSTDGRARTLVLTAAGKAMRERLLAGAHTRSPFSALDTKEQRQLSRLLAKALRRKP